MVRSALTKKITRTRLKAFLTSHQTEKKTLDIGCSTSAYKHLFPNSVGVDIDPKKNPDVVGDAHDLPFPDESFEVVLCTEVLEHLHTPQRAIDEMHRVLKVGGTLILTTRFVYPMHDAPHDYFRFTRYGLSHLLRAWKEVIIVPEAESMEAFQALFQWLAQRMTLRGGRVSKALFLILGWFIAKLSVLVIEERTSGRTGPKHIEKAIMTTGYYLTATKKS